MLATAMPSRWMVVARVIGSDGDKLVSRMEYG
jgi:hypothetical protein